MILEKEMRMMLLLKVRASALALAFVVLCRASCLAAMPAGESASAGVSLELLEEYLLRAAVECDCYFTVETFVPAGEPEYGALGLRIPRSPSTGSVDTLIANLGKAVPGMRVFRDVDNPAIVRLIHVRLNEIKSYVMDREVTLDVKSSPDDLLFSLQKTAPSLSPRRTGPIGGGRPWGDMFTPLEFSAKNVNIRRVMTDGIPLSRYQRIIWLSQTIVEPDGLHTVVDYQGRPRPYEPSALAKKPLPFEVGEAAFRRNAKSPEAIAAAVDYIDAQMKTENPFQVRWAMFYLGKQGVPEAVPLLLKHLTYRYTTCGVFEESYPAALALSMMGKTGSAAAMQAIGTETDSLRLKLLCRVVLLVEGQDNGAKAVEAEAAKSAGDRQQLIRDALKAAAGPQVLPAAPVAK
jgi:hypothetical protein